MLALLWSFMREAGVHEWNIMLNQIIHMNWLTQKKKEWKINKNQTDLVLTFSLTQWSFTSALEWSE